MIARICLDRKYVLSVSVHTFSFLSSVLHFDVKAFVFRLKSPFDISEEIPYVESQKPLKSKRTMQGLFIILVITIRVSIFKYYTPQRILKRFSLGETQAIIMIVNYKVRYIWLFIIMNAYLLQCFIAIFF